MYRRKIEISEKDGCFVGSVLGVADSLCFHGKTLAELEEAFQVCIDDYPEMCRVFGRKP